MDKLFCVARVSFHSYDLTQEYKRYRSLEDAYREEYLLATGEYYDFDISSIQRCFLDCDMLVNIKEVPEQ